MIVAVCALLAALVPVLLGGRPGRFAVLRLRGTQLVAGAFVVQLAALSLLPWPRPLLAAAHVGSYVAAAVFVVLNRRVPGIAVVGAGALTNGLTIAVNGGTLPAAPAALVRAGLSTGSAASGFVNSGALAHPRLALLGDVFAVPAGWPLANVFSVGDLMVVAGAGYASWRVCGTRWTVPWQPREAGHARGRHVDGLFAALVDDPDDAPRAGPGGPLVPRARHARGRPSGRGPSGRPPRTAAGTVVRWQTRPAPAAVTSSSRSVAAGSR